MNKIFGIMALICLLTAICSFQLYVSGIDLKFNSHILLGIMGLTLCCTAIFAIFNREKFLKKTLITSSIFLIILICYYVGLHAK
ncbi:hypothetical protein ABE44_26270 [Bacillus thuringiensis]|uniref:Uncharacterized protein n=1 Tax=Bacillus thuringiensis YBT-1518 TaxID=529122 RepID=A0A9W3KLS1_BACTU|nr:hypothetical protein YBT1518_29050 [Bacillus thuringiensis YBT-1518]MBG9483631.1 hypothetical protein [Bacillus thuringiensis]MBG9502419.1 hypothetical protein [Bacillus thuringiensis]PGL16919.1 hypothetical protein CN916_30265 [Bacillus thuringiensis]